MVEKEYIEKHIKEYELEKYLNKPPRKVPMSEEELALRSAMRNKLLAEFAMSERAVITSTEQGHQIEVNPQDRAKILSPFDQVFFDDELLDDIVTRTSIPNLIGGTEPAYSGVILYGPPGTGKTVLLKAIAEVYQLAGAYSTELSVAGLNTSYVGQFAKNLEAEIQKALEEAGRRGRPSFLFFDEASILAQKASEGAYSVSKHYQEANDVLKKYIGNERSLVVGISTNLLSESCDGALTREGRLTSRFIDYPTPEQRKRMWKYFANQYGIMDLSDKQAESLAGLLPSEQGAFIEEFCRNYNGTRKSAILREKGHRNLVEALKHGANIPDEQAKSTITFDILYNDLIAALKEKYKRTEKPREDSSKICTPSAGYL